MQATTTPQRSLCQQPTHGTRPVGPASLERSPSRSISDHAGDPAALEPTGRKCQR